MRFVRFELAVFRRQSEDEESATKMCQLNNTKSYHTIVNPGKESTFRDSGVIKVN